MRRPRGGLMRQRPHGIVALQQSEKHGADANRAASRSSSAVGLQSPDISDCGPPPAGPGSGEGLRETRT